jgi:hypothetical protein
MHANNPSKGPEPVFWSSDLALDLQEYLNLVDSLAYCLADERLRLIRQAEQLVEFRLHWEAEQVKLRQELNCLQTQRSVYEDQVAELKAQVENLAALWLLQSDQDAFPAAKAA